MARLVMEQLMTQGKIVRGWLGVAIQDITSELSQKFGIKGSRGALVSDVTKGSPAEKAGIARGDVILEFNGKEVTSVGGLRNMVSQSRAGAEVSVKILRGGKEYTLKAVVAELPKEAAGTLQEPFPEDARTNAFSGITVKELTREIARQLGIGFEEKGVVIVRIEPGSPADDAGLKRGDVIQEIDRKRITGVEEYKRIAAATQPGDTSLLFVNRGGKKFYLTLNK
jgi:serine protease Do